MGGEKWKKKSEAGRSQGEKEVWQEEYMYIAVLTELINVLIYLLLT